MLKKKKNIYFGKYYKIGMCDLTVVYVASSTPVQANGWFF